MLIVNSLKYVWKAYMSMKIMPLNSNSWNTVVILNGFFSISVQYSGVAHSQSLKPPFFCCIYPCCCRSSISPKCASYCPISQLYRHFMAVFKKTKQVLWYLRERECSTVWNVIFFRTAVPKKFCFLSVTDMIKKKVTLINHKIVSD